MQGQAVAFFHPGQPSPPSKAKRRVAKPPRPACSIKLSWYILPASVAPDADAHFTLSSIGTNYQAAMTALKNLSSLWGEGLLSTVYSSQRTEQLIRLVEANARIRHAGRCLLKRWMTKRLVRVMNEEDIVTLEPPRQPVTVYDWSARKSYTYEASTIARDMRECLLQRDYMFPDPIPPRNLLTNQALTPLQLRSVLYQLRTTRKQLHWTLAAFEGHDFSLSCFKRMHEHALRQEVLRGLFAQPTLEDTRSIVFDYISDEHEYREKPFSKAIYSWALLHAPTAYRIQRWRLLAHRHHELCIQIADELERVKAQEKEMDACAEELCSPPNDLILLRAEWKQKEIRSTSRVPSSS